LSRKRKPVPKILIAKKKPPRWQHEKNVSRFLWIVIPLVIAIIVILVSYWSYDSYIAVWHRPVAKVNETTLDMDYYVKMLRFYSRNPELTIDTSIYPSQVLRVLEDNELILQFAPDLDINVTSDEIMEEIKSFVLPPTDDGGNLTQEDLDFEDLYDKWLERIQLSKEKYEHLVEADLLLGNITQYFKENEVPLETEQVYLHIMLLEDEATALEVKNKLNTGGNFTELAREYSLVDELKEAGGNAGWVPKGIYPGLDDVIFSLGVGNVSEPIATEQGFYIAEISDIDENRSVPEGYRDVIANNTFENWLIEQREASIIEEYLNQGRINWAINHL
jgi:foldase protein PrsA